MRDVMGGKDDLVEAGFMGDVVQEIVIGGAWVFLGNVLSWLSGFFFWLVMAKLIGTEALGTVSAVISCSTIAVIFASAGLEVAVMKEVAVKKLNALVTAFFLTLFLGLVSGVLVVLLTSWLGLSHLGVIAFCLSFAIIFSIPFLSGLIGLERFRAYFMASFTGSLVKFIIGVALTFLGLGILGPLLGYLAYPISSSIIAATLILSSQMLRDIRLRLDDLKSLVTLSFSNYPYMFSNQLLSMLSLYIFTFLRGELASTAVLYIILMITSAISAIPNSLLSSSLPIGIRRNINPFNEGFRIGLGVITPILAMILAAPTLILQTINPEFIEGVNALRIMILSIAPLTALNTVVVKLNKSGRRKELMIIGVGRLCILMILLPLIRFMGIDGAAIALLMANTALIPLALKMEPSLSGLLFYLWTLHILIALFATTTSMNEVFKAIIAIAASTTVSHFISICKFSEYLKIFKLVFRSIFLRQV